jgi:hypothetical protein
MVHSSHIVVLLGETAAPNGPGLPHSRDFWITHNDALGLLWTCDQLVARDLYLATYTKLTTDKRPWYQWGLNPQSQQTYALDRTAPGTGLLLPYILQLDFIKGNSYISKRLLPYIICRSSKLNVTISYRLMVSVSSIRGQDTFYLYSPFMNLIVFQLHPRLSDLKD